jgi:hypothetical protein
MDALTDVERGILLHVLAERHPRITKQLLDQIDLYRKRDAAREAMPHHPFTQHERVPDLGMMFCFFRHNDATCLREKDHTVHADPVPEPE